MPSKILMVLCLAAAHLAAVDAADRGAPFPASPQEARPLTVGSTAPMSVMVRRTDGTAITLAAATGGAPTVLVFYRGGWCPFCTRHLVSCF